MKYPIKKKHSLCLQQSLCQQHNTSFSSHNKISANRWKHKLQSFLQHHGAQWINWEVNGFHGFQEEETHTCVSHMCIITLATLFSFHGSSWTHILKKSILHASLYLNTFKMTTNTPHEPLYISDMCALLSVLSVIRTKKQKKIHTYHHYVNILPLLNTLKLTMQTLLHLRLKQMTTVRGLVQKHSIKVKVDNKKWDNSSRGAEFIQSVVDFNELNRYDNLRWQCAKYQAVCWKASG